MVVDAGEAILSNRAISNSGTGFVVADAITFIIIYYTISDRRTGIKAVVYAGVIPSNRTIRYCGTGIVIVVDAVDTILSNRAIRDRWTGVVVEDARAIIPRNRTIIDCGTGIVVVVDTTTGILRNLTITDCWTGIGVIDATGFRSSYNYRIDLCCVCKSIG